MRITSCAYGVTGDGKAVDCYTLTNSRGMSVTVINYGTAITSLLVPDRDGRPVDVVLGFDGLSGYEQDDSYMGVCTGRVANRLKDMHFNLGGRECVLEPNEGLNHLHGVFGKRVWDAQVHGGTVRMSYRSPDGEDGFPGNLDVSVTYALDENNVLTLRYEAVSDADTLINLTNHSYFNLSGHNSGTVDDQLLQIAAEEYLETADDSCPTGVILPVEGTPMDFRKLRRIGQGFPIHFEQMELVGGYDHCYCLRSGAAPAVLAYSPQSGIAMHLVTTQPGVQLYTGNYLSGTVAGKGGAHYNRRAGFCLETQHYPCATSYPAFPSIVLPRGKEYHQTTLLQFQTLESM